MSKYKFVRCLLVAFLVLTAGKALTSTFADMSKHEDAVLMYYPDKDFAQLDKEFSEMVTKMHTVGQPADLAQSFIQANKWEGSVKFFQNRTRHTTSDVVARQRDMLKSKTDLIQSVQNEASNLYIRKYGTAVYNDVTYLQLMHEHQMWEESLKAGQELSGETRQAWLLLLVHLLWCTLVFVASKLVEQGAGFGWAFKYAAYITVALLVFAGGSVGIVPSVSAQTTATVKVTKEKNNEDKDKEEEKTDDVDSASDTVPAADEKKSGRTGKSEKADNTFFRPKVTFAAIELLGSPQRNGGQIEIAQEAAFEWGQIKGATVSSFEFVEIRKDQSFNFGQISFDVAHPKWYGLKGISSVGFSGRKAHASFGAGIALMKSPLGDHIKGVDFLDVNFFHGIGAVAKNEVQIVYSTKPIRITKKAQLVATGFYRIRNLDSISDNYGQPQLQFTHDNWKKVAFVYEAEIAGKSVTHLFGIKLFLR